MFCMFNASVVEFVFVCALFASGVEFVNCCPFGRPSTERVPGEPPGANYPNHGSKNPKGKPGFRKTAPQVSLNANTFYARPPTYTKAYNRESEHVYLCTLSPAQSTGHGPRSLSRTSYWPSLDSHPIKPNGSGTGGRAQSSLARSSLQKRRLQNWWLQHQGPSRHHLHFERCELATCSSGPIGSEWFMVSSDNSKAMHHRGGRHSCLTQALGRPGRVKACRHITKARTIDHGIGMP
jgi:hypothetical protein